MDLSIRRLTQGDITQMKALNDLFGRVFEQPDIYSENPPNRAWLFDLLSDPNFVCLVAEAKNGQIAGGVCAYILKKFEQQRSELFVYDLGVDEAWRRQGVATALIQHLKPVAQAVGAWVIVITADDGDTPATSLYRKLGVEERTLHYDIQP